MDTPSDQTSASSSPHTRDTVNEHQHTLDHTKDSMYFGDTTMVRQPIHKLMMMLMVMMVLMSMMLMMMLMMMPMLLMNILMVATFQRIHRSVYHECSFIRARAHQENPARQSASEIHGQ
jgi:hypothetical protein